MRSSAALSLRRARPVSMRAAHRMNLTPTAPRSMPQDLPPQGGYEPVQYKRNLPAKGLRPVWYIVGGAVIVAYGWYKLALGIEEWNELGREKMWSRIHLIPLLQAEEDRDQARRYYANQERERELLGDTSKIYNSDRFVRPTYTINPGVSKD